MPNVYHFRIAELSLQSEHPSTALRSKSCMTARHAPWRVQVDVQSGPGLRRAARVLRGLVGGRYTVR